jgi:hypothetical protein
MFNGGSVVSENECHFKNNILVMSWWSVLLVEETEILREN